MLIEGELSLLVLAKLPCACSVASLVLGMPIISDVSFGTADCSSNPAPPFLGGAAACHGGVGGAIGPIASKEGRFYNRPGVVTQKAERDSPQNNETVQRGLRRGSNSLVLFLHNRLPISDRIFYYFCRTF